MAAETAGGKRYSLDVPYLGWAYRRLVEFHEVLGQVSRTYRL